MYTQSDLVLKKTTNIFNTQTLAMIAMLSALSPHLLSFLFRCFRPLQ